MISWALGHRKSTIALPIVAFVAAIGLLPFVGGGFTPESDNSEFAVKFEVPEGSALARVAGVKTSVLEAGGLGGAQAPLAIELRGSGVDELRRISTR